MIGRPERFLQPWGAVLANCQQTIRKTLALFPSNPFEPLTYCLCNGRRHTLSGQPRQLFCKPVRFIVFDIQTHLFNPYTAIMRPFYPGHQSSSTFPEWRFVAYLVEALIRRRGGGTPSMRAYDDGAASHR